MRGPSYFGQTRSISELLLMSPGYQQPWYWLCRICRFWSYWRKDFKYLFHINVSNDIKCKYMFMFPQHNLACKELTMLVKEGMVIKQVTWVYPVLVIIRSVHPVIFIKVSDKVIALPLSHGTLAHPLLNTLEPSKVKLRETWFGIFIPHKHLKLIFSHILWQIYIYM